MSGSLDHSPADVVRQLLIDLGLGTNPDDSGAWPIYCSQTPSTPDSAITVYDTEGRQGGRVMTDGERQEHSGIQIAIRDANHVNGFAKSKLLAIALDKTVSQNSVVISEATYLVHSISRTGDVIVAGKNVPTDKRNLFTINAVVSLRQSS